MPTYEYYCEKCDEKFENAVPLAHWSRFGVCPTCGYTKSVQYFGSVPNTLKPMEPYFDNGLNMQMNTREQRAAELKRRDLVEIGSDKSYEYECKELVAQCRDKKKQKT